MYMICDDMVTDGWDEAQAYMWIYGADRYNMRRLGLEDNDDGNG